MVEHDMIAAAKLFGNASVADEVKPGYEYSCDPHCITRQLADDRGIDAAPYCIEQRRVTTESLVGMRLVAPPDLICGGEESVELSTAMATADAASTDVPVSADERARNFYA